MVADVVEEVVQEKPTIQFSESQEEMSSRLKAQTQSDDWLQQHPMPSCWSIDGNDWRVRHNREMLERLYAEENADEFRLRELRVELAVRLDGEILVPMSADEWDAEMRDVSILKIDRTAESIVESWNDAAMQYGILGTSLLYQKSIGITTKAADWDPAKVIVLDEPQFRAWQIESGQPEVAVAIYDGNKFADSIVVKNPGPGMVDFYGAGCGGSELSYFLVPGGTIAAKFIKSGMFHQKPVENPIASITIDVQNFLKAADLAAACTSNDETRMILTGALLEAFAWGIRLSGTDTYRLACIDCDATVKYAEGKEPIDGHTPHGIVPRAFLGLLVKGLAKAKGEMEILFDDDHISVTHDGQTIKHYLIDGQFVNYPKVIPQESDEPLIINAKDWINAIEKLMPVAVDDAKRIVLRINENGTKMSAASGQFGGVEVEQRLSTPTSNYNRELAFDGKYTIDYLSRTEGDVVLHLAGPLNSMMFTNGNTKYVQMPMQVM